MATKADFTPDEWEVLQFAVSDTMAYVSIADPGFWDSFKEATGAAKYVADARNTSPSALVRDLASNVKGKHDKELSGGPVVAADEVVARVKDAASIVAEKAADELAAFKAFILGLAEATAEASEGVDKNESAAIDQIKDALG